MGSSKGKGKGDRRSTDERKKKSQCASCKQYGHWHGDAECPNVKNGKDPPRQPGTGGTQVNFTSAEGSPASVKTEGSARVHRVNWTFPVFSADGWDLLEAYDSPEEEEEEPEEPQDMLPFSSGPLTPEKAKADKVKKHRLALKTVLEALIAEEDDEEIQQRLRKKEYKAAREEETRLRKVKESPKKHAPESRPMELDLSPKELLQVLPHMSPVEKQALCKALKQEVEGTAADHIPEYDQEKLTRPGHRNGGYTYSSKPKPKPTAAGPSTATAASSSAGSLGEPPASQSESKLPDAVRKKRLKEFRIGLYQNSLDRRGRVRPSDASEVPTAEQAACPHAWADLRWGANQAAHWATCRKCHLRKVLYYSMEHGALMMDEEEAEPTWLLRGGAMQVILDTGCRTAVVGAIWHRNFQEELKQRQLPYFVVQHHETFRFGAGEPVISTTAYVYPIRLGDSGEVTWLRLAEVCNTASDHRVEQCPALVGPSEMARWRVSMNFNAGVTEIAGHVAETQLSDTRHPVLRVLPEGPAEAWLTPEMTALKETLLKDPYSLALLQQGPEETGDTTEEEELAAPADPDECHDLAMWQETMEDEAIMCLDHVLAQQEGESLLALAAPEDESASDGSISEGESETSHEDGPDEPSDGETDSEGSQEEANVLGADLPGDTEILNKGQRRRLLDAVQKVSEVAEKEAHKKIPREKMSRRRPGPWRILEIFTWTCALTQVACDKGWSTYEPVTLDSGWDLESPGVQEKAFRYLQEVDPDVVMVAWPCGP